jgi:16S rRNA (guanine1207-N2)-methyltransferase
VPAAQHYFSERPEVASRPQEVTVRLQDMTLNLRTDRGVFSLAGLDPGTEFLLRAAPPPPEAGTLLDLGCGHGIIAVALGRRAPRARVLAVDVNRRALDLAAENARANQAGNVEVLHAGEVAPDVGFDAIYSNPPVRVGKTALHQLLGDWLGRLSPGGHAYLVVLRHLGADSLAGWLRGQGYEVARLGSRRGYRLLDVHATRPTPHHP